MGRRWNHQRHRDRAAGDWFHHSSNDPARLPARLRRRDDFRHRCDSSDHLLMNICLLLLIVIPLAGALVGALIPARLAKGWALAVSLATAAAALPLVPPLLQSGPNAHVDFSTRPQTPDG